MKKHKTIPDDGFRADLVSGAQFDGIFEIPVIHAPEKIIIPDNLIPFTSRKQTNNHTEFVSFYVHDKYFSDLLANPEEYLDELKVFPGIITPDCSLYRDMPLSLQIANTYTNRKIGYYYQKQGINVIPNIRWGDERSYTRCLFPEPFAFSGVSKNSIVSIGCYGCIKSPTDRKYFIHGLDAMLKELAPNTVIVYGSKSPQIFDPYMNKSNFIFFEDWTSQKKGVK